MGKLKAKYLLSVAVVLIFVQFVFGLPVAPSVLQARLLHQQDTLRQDSVRRDSIRQIEQMQRMADSILAVAGVDYDSLRTLEDTVVQRRRSGAGLDRIIKGRATDSLYYDMRKKMVYIYEKGDVTYDNMNLQADFMNIDLDSKNIYAYGKADTIDGEPTVTRPLFTQGGTSLNMDTIAYNIESQRAKIKGIATQQGDGWLIGHDVKKMQDNSIHIADGMYTTCDQTEHPHFYYYMSKAKVIPGDKGKVIMGGGHLVIEDVDIPFLGLPEGFFPLSSGPKSGILMPTYGEEARRGFFMRGLGYYFTLSDHMDLALTGGFYTLGSWEAQAVSRYVKRYKYSGSFNLDYASVRSGDKGDPDFVKQNTYRIQWTHSQDAKANPGSTFSASVNLSSSGYSRYSATTLNDMLSTQTNSSIAYSKNWAGTPFSLSMNMAVSQNSQTEAISVTLPNISFNVSKFFPLKRKVKL
ncbi:MAG: LPS-assembly protein LptD, partial [Alistipes sp.]|nr:LPS-assembly protein LptD [Alistipes sp.]